MNVFGIITEYLQSIPPAVRKYILLAYAVAVVIVSILGVLQVELDYAKVNGVLMILGGYLGVQSAANVPTGGAHRADVPVDQPPVAPPADRGNGAA